MSSTGCEIFCCLMVSECLVVKLLFGIAGGPSVDFAARLVVKARDREVDMVAWISERNILAQEDEILGYKQLVLPGQAASRRVQGRYRWWLVGVVNYPNRGHDRDRLNSCSPRSNSIGGRSVGCCRASATFRRWCAFLFKSRTD
jgi:hypothetical protein